ncbi:CapA family protein [Fulvivirgaceae bacterium BMA10]|uniref:CapA family protein n=1 Tax=Splendidivirga corallicola TaxID=3051826 RepID=A0ABT8KHQ9_9BACT|nr:CapA family protein [Fulvivirgaceae bacterium BMA10]
MRSTQGIILLIVFIGANLITKAQENDTINEITLLFIGDIMQHDSQIKHAYDPKTQGYDYHTGLEYIKPVIEKADYTIANLELTLGGRPYKGYPQFSAPDELAVALKDNGVDFLVTANNHSCDRRSKGITRTISLLDSLQIPHTGTFVDSEARKETYPHIIEQKGFKIALLNYTYGTNGIPAPKPHIVNLIDKATIKTDLETAQQQNPDKIIVFVHWGSEYKQQPNSFQKDLANFMIEHGADIIIGSHPHVLQRMEHYYDKEREKDIAIVYSLGNFVSNQRTPPRDGGAMAQITLVKSEDKVQIKHAGYYLTWVYPHYENGRKYWHILPAAQYEQNPDFFDPGYFEKMKSFIDNSRNLLNKENINVFEQVYDNEAGAWKAK